VQSQVLTTAFCVSEMFEIYDSAIRQAQEVHEQCSLSGVDKTHKEKEFLFR
jgi:hypothetical protein